jgi:hypothetical protein
VNLLIAGGLLIIGVIALVALVFVIRSESITEESESVPPPVPTRQQEVPEADATPSTVPTPPVSDTSVTSTSDKQVTSTWQPLANGQFYELKNELQSLHGQAQELEYRIRTLVDMLEHVEQDQNEHSSSEERPSSTTTRIYKTQ